MPKSTRQILEEVLETEGLSFVWREPHVGRGRLV